MTYQKKPAVHSPLLSMDDVDWDMKNPCDQCPFLRSTPYHEGVAASLVGYHESIVAGTFGHTCHKTDNRPAVDGPKNSPLERPKHCVGAVMMLLKSGEGADLQLPLLNAAEAGKIDLKEMTKRAHADRNVFSVVDLLMFYAYRLKVKAKEKINRIRKGRRRAPKGKS